MSDETAREAKQDWYKSKTLVLSWVLIFFPVGLYGVWKGDHFIKNVKLGIFVAVAMAFLGLGINFTHPLYVFVCFPVGLYLLWRDKEIDRKIFKRFAFAFPVVLFLALIQASYTSAPNTNDGGSGGSCAAVITEGNCTYYRDDNCNVISRSCS